MSDLITGFSVSRDNYYGKQYGKQYYHEDKLNESLMVSGLRYYTPVIGKITVVILVRDRCPRGRASDEELEGPMKDQPLSADASPTALSPAYIADSDLEEDKEDPEEDPPDYPADG
ncbi:hypothetical protein Tco_0296433 [Tanacetum coccineum]